MHVLPEVGGSLVLVDFPLIAVYSTWYPRYEMHKR